MTKFKTPKAFFIKNNELRAGQILYAKYPDKIFQIDLLAPFLQRWAIYNEFIKHRESKYVYPFEAVFNQIYDTLKRPFAINSNDSYFSNIKDYNSFYEFDKWGGVKLKDFCDGCIMLESFDKIEPVHFINDWVTNEEELNEVKNVLPEEDARKIKTVQDLINYINPNLDMRGIRKYHDLKKFW